MPQHHIALFSFTLGSSESIGPHALRHLWADACNTGPGDVSVGRRLSHDSRHDRPIYTLYAPQSLDDLREVELRLRRALEDAHLHASLTAMP